MKPLIIITINKTILLLAILLGSLIQAQAQTWFPNGAKWYYGWRYYRYVPPYIIQSAEIIEVEKDTVVLGKACKKLVRTNSPTGSLNRPVNYVYDSAGKVYYYPPLNSFGFIENDEWSLLLDFTKSVGDTIFYPNIRELSNGGADTIMYYNVVDYVSIDTINNQALKSYSSTPSLDFWPFRMYFATSGTEVLGEGGPIFYGRHWSYAGFTSAPDGMRCYEDSILGLFKPTNMNLDCDKTYPTGFGNQLNSKMKVFPNPSDGIIHIELMQNNNQEFVLKIFDLNGSLIKKERLKNDIERLDISNIEDGIYFYEIQVESDVFRDKLLIRK